MERTRFGAAVLTSKLKVSKGDPIALYIAVVNQSEDDLVVKFPTSQQFDFALLDKKGKEYWRWSQGKVFIQVESQFKVPASPKVGFHVDGDELKEVPLPPQIDEFVTLIGELPSSNMPFTGKVRIETV
jgi:Intracellular proteinase inhibitor